MSINNIITIDGPSASGKGTVAVKLASSLGWHILPSGNIYRTVALNMQRHNINEEDEDSIVKLAQKTKVLFKIERNQLFSYLLSYDEESGGNSEPIDKHLLASELSRLASHIAKYSKLRQVLLPLQRSFAQDPGLVAEGRDMGTVVFPDAQTKIYLDASAATRAKRRYVQLREADKTSISEEQVLNEIISRDHADTTRANAPLKQDLAAIAIKTDDLSANQVVAEIINKLL